MQLNRQTDFALRTLIFLAAKGNKALSNIDEIAENFNIMREHLVKIVSKLAKLGYIITYRGKGGGLKINQETLNLPLSEIIINFEPTFKVIDCEHLSCPMNGICRLNDALDQASKAFINILKQYQLNDILPVTRREKAMLGKRLNIKVITELR